MTLTLDKSAWKRVSLGEVVRHVTDRVDAETSGLERFLAGEHIPSSNLAISEWGMVGRDPIGPMFYKRFQAGHVLYVSRRTYLRKVAVPEFEGITGEKTFVLETLDPSVLLQEFLPFVLSAECFHAYAIANSRGSVNPYLNWGELAGYEFDLPPLDEQIRIANLLWAVEHLVRSQAVLRDATVQALEAWSNRQISTLIGDKVVPFSKTWARSPESGWSSLPVDEPTGHYVLSLAALGPEGYRAGKLKSIAETRQSRAAMLRRGDLLISRANTQETVGRAGIFTEDRSDVSFPDTMMRVSLIDGVRPQFAAAVLSSAHGRAHMRRSAAGSATSMVKINRASLGRMEFPMISIDAQDAFLSELDRLLLAVRSIDSELATIGTVRSSLLAEISGGN